MRSRVRKRYQRSLSIPLCMQGGKAKYGCGEKVPFYKPEGGLTRTFPDNSSLILNFWPPELWENTFLLFKPLSLRYYIMAAWTEHSIHTRDMSPIYSYGNCLLLSCAIFCTFSSVLMTTSQTMSIVFRIVLPWKRKLNENTYIIANLWLSK